MMRKLSALVLATMSTAAVGQNLIANGSFESPTVAPSSFLAFVANSNLSGWSVLGSGSAVMLLSTTYAEPNLTFASQAGVAAIDLTGAGNTGTTNSVSQTVTTLPGQVYRLEFWVGNADGSGNSSYTMPSSIALSINNGSLQTFVNSDVTNRSVNWRAFSVEFTATGASTTIAFSNATPIGDNYAGLDNVVLSAVPEPHPLLLAAIGLPYLVWYRNRRSRVRSIR